MTDSQGRFDIETRAPAVVFRKDGFQSKYWRLGADRNLAIALSANPAPRMKECEPSSQWVSLEGFESAFCLPRIAGVHVGRLGRDVDYVYRWFWVGTDWGKAAIQHAAGLLWGSGLPLDQDVWSARDYVETSYRDPKGLFVIDARGKSGDGKCWRVLGRFGETAAYRNVPEQDTALLDRVLDGACIDATRLNHPK